MPQVADQVSSQEAISLDQIVDESFYDSEYALGQFGPFPYSDQDFALLSDDDKRKLIELDLICARSDVASRRFEVEQTWEAELFKRGYQHLLPRKGGGWEIFGQNSRTGITATSDAASVLSTNTYGRDHDIIVAALSREVPNGVFVPTSMDDGSS